MHSITQEDDPVLAEYLDREGAAAELNVCARTLDRWRMEGHGPAHTKLGRKILYRRGALREHLRRQERA